MNLMFNSEPLNTPMVTLSAPSPTAGAEFRPYVSVHDGAQILDVSESWIRRHIGELPAVRVGRLVRLDSALLLRQFQGKNLAGNRLKPKRINPMWLRRYQRGYVYKRGKRLKAWYGMWREDVLTADGAM